MPPVLPKPVGIPDNWIEKPTDDPGGKEYVNPENPNDRVRVMPGKPNSRYAHQQRPYVIDQNGGYRDVNGNPIPGPAPRSPRKLTFRTISLDFGGKVMAPALSTHLPIPDQLRTGWFRQIYEISNIDLQRRTWLDASNQNPHWSYIEFRGSYPDEDQLLHAQKQGWLTTDEFEILSGFRRIVIAHSPPGGNYYDNAAVLDDPTWHSVVEAAECARQQLLSITTDQKEREMLLGDA